MTITEIERDLYREMWQVPDYATHSPGAQRVEMFCDMAGITSGHGYSIIDAGTGTGKGALALQALGFEVRLCDLTADGLVPAARELRFESVCLWQDLRSQLRYLHGGTADFVYCVDVLEHVPTQLTMLAVANMLAVARRGVFVGVSLVEDNFGVWAGQPLHRTVQPFVWWKQSLAEVGRVVEARDLLDSAAFWVTR